MLRGSPRTAVIHVPDRTRQHPAEAGHRASDLGGTFTTEDTPADRHPTSVSRDTRELLIDLIDPDPDQPRREIDADSIIDLANSIATNGLIHPITVRPQGDRFVVVAGERRLRAVRHLEFNTVAAFVRDDLADLDVIWLQATENLSRSDMSPVDEAVMFARLSATGASHSKIARRLGVSRSVVTQKLRLLNLPAPLTILLQRRLISEGHARQLLRLQSILETGVDKPSAEPVSAERVESVMSSDHLAASLQVQMRPLDGCIFGFFITEEIPHHRTLLLAARTWFREAVSRDTEVESWERAAVHFGLLAATGGVSVADLRELLDTYQNFISSALMAAWLEPSGVPLWEHQSREWWCYRSDLRHAGLEHVIGDPTEAERLFWVTPMSERFAMAAAMEERGLDAEFRYMAPSAVAFADARSKGQA